ncbi:hypothetical protein [Membranihabitans maritimus]|uniref:hypothetical protein n=1 Tax=Membranihabitans maritimus TaxID=2904244 RepID=UPI001F322795|nr:hypothetical protein [Membranihabitans maritimus]
MRIYFLLLLPLILLIGCSPYGNLRANLGMGYDTIDYGSRVSRDRTRAQVSLQYLSRIYYAKKILKEAKSFHYTSEEKRGRLEALPKSGYLAINVRGGTIDDANPRNWYIMVKDGSGNLIQRLEGKDETPSFSITEYGTAWSEFQLIPIDFEVPNPFKVTVISKLDKRYNEFTVWPDYEEADQAALDHQQRMWPYSVATRVQSQMSFSICK